MPGSGEELAEVWRRSPNLEELILTSNATFDSRYFRDVLLAGVQKICLVRLFGECDMTFLAKLCPNVTSLEVQLTYSEDPAALVVAFKRLRSLVLDYETENMDVVLIRIADGCPQLRDIDVRLAVALTDASVVHLCSQCTLLESIRLRFCYDITDAVLQAIGDHLSTTLRELELEGCIAIKSCAALQSCRLLECLNLSTLTQANLENLHKVFTGCPALRIVNISGKVIDDAVVRALSHCCPLLQELNMI